MASTSSSSANANASGLSGTTQDDRNRQIALHHATLLQQRKDTEATILNALEELIEFPTDPSSDADRPSPEDLKRFQELVALFQVSDYDSLIEERNCADKCGYVFCPDSLKRKESSGNYSRIVRGNRRWGSTHDQSFQIVPSAKFEMWSEPFCAKAALYIKLQLTELPAWERAAGTTTKIIVFSDLTYGEIGSEMVRIASERRESGEVRQILKELALERGERSESSQRITDIPIREVLDFLRPPAEPRGTGHGDEIEGYRPGEMREVRSEPQKMRSGGEDDAEDDDKEDDEDRDWDLT